MKNYVIDLLIRELEDYKGEKIAGYEFAYKLLEQYNVDESVTYSIYDAQNWLKAHYGDMYEFLSNYRSNYGDEALTYLTLDIFGHSERAMTTICLEVANDIMSSLDYIQDNWDNEITLDKKTIEVIKKELEEQRECE